MGEIIKVNSNEVPYEVQDEGGECWSQHETLEDAVKAFHETAKLKRDENGYTAEDEGDGAYLMLALYRGVAGKTCVDDYELQPTAEWSRIQQALKELEEFKSRLPVNADGDVVLWGDEVWGMSHSGNPFKIVVEEIQRCISKHDGREFFDIKGKNGSGGACRLHSTAESCRAANEKGE